MALSDVLPPACPNEFIPQHHTPPVADRAHVCCHPAVIAVMLERYRGVGVAVPVVSTPGPNPSCPLQLSPQQKTDPLPTTAHVCWEPAVTVSALVRAGVGPGAHTLALEGEVAVEMSPN